MRLRLLDLPGTPLRPVPLSTPADVCARWSRRIPLHLPLEVLPLLDAWAADSRAGAGARGCGADLWLPSRFGPGRTPEDAASLIAFLRTHAEAGTAFSFSALWKEKQGGRSYPFHLPDYVGSLAITRGAYEAVGRAGPRHLLAAIRRDVRALLEPPEGYTLLCGDYKCCHGNLAFALSGDDQLADDLAGDFHRAIGDQLVGSKTPAKKRRDFGKAFDNAMLFGVTPYGLQRNILEEFNTAVSLDWARKKWTWWWSRYPKLATFRNEVIELVAQAQQSNMALEIVAPSGRVSRFSAAEVKGQVAKGSRKPAKGPSGAWRTVFSAAFRAVEGDLLDRLLAHWQVQEKRIECGHLVMPLYDGLYVGAQVETGGTVAFALKLAAERAATELGVPEMRMVVPP